MSPALLEITDLHVAYGKVEAVRGVSLAVAAGSIVTVIGANGAGKTTTLNAIAGLLPARGTIRFDGAALQRMPTEDRVAAGLVLVPERRELFGSMPVEDNLRLGGYRFGRAVIAAGLEEVYARFPRLRERRRQAAGTLSGGERQMLALGRALMARPRLLMLDEPSLGLAPQIVRDSFRIIGALRDAGVSILLVEQNARAALAIADRGYVMERSTIRIAGDAADLLRDPRLIDGYLGLGGEAEAVGRAGHLV
jgi:branched-chain amino acid transport system ATP-binding protein